MRRALTLACAGLAFGAGSAVAGPPVEKHIDPDAGWMVHVDLDAVADTEIGEFLMQMISAETDDFEDIREVMPNFWPGPEGGVFGLTAYGTSLDIEGGDGAEDMCVILYGDDQISGWGSMLHGIALHEGMGDEIRHRQVRGHDAWSFPLDDAGRGYAGLVEKGRNVAWIIAFDSGTFDDALGLFDEGRGDTDLMPRGGWRDGTIAYISTNTLDGLDVDEKASRVLGDARSLRMRVGEEDGEAYFQGALDTGDDENARSIVSIAQGLLAIGNLAAADDEELREVMRVAQGFSFDVEGSTVYIELTHDAEEVVEFLEEASEASNVDINIGDPEYHGEDDHDDDW
ncbi:MAG: hypothetical protein ED559_01095 [Phycisphaera sp.]|nr:MAG: hypothetical protein ED559_01095 [Phycisphaera sp.]